MNVTDLYITATTALTLLFFSVVGDEFGFYCSFIVFVMWFMIWCAIKTLVAIIDASRDQGVTMVEFLSLCLILFIVFIVFMYCLWVLYHMYL